MDGKKVFVSYDYDNDRHLKATLVGQSKTTRMPIYYRGFFT